MKPWSHVGFLHSHASIESGNIMKAIVHDVYETPMT